MSYSDDETTRKIERRLYGGFASRAPVGPTVGELDELLGDRELTIRVRHRDCDGGRCAYWYAEIRKIRKLLWQGEARFLGELLGELVAFLEGSGSCA